jgi:hypothetical protein
VYNEKFIQNEYLFNKLICEKLFLDPELSKSLFNNRRENMKFVLTTDGYFINSAILHMDTILKSDKKTKEIFISLDDKFGTMLSSTLIMSHIIEIFSDRFSDNN